MYNNKQPSTPFQKSLSFVKDFFSKPTSDWSRVVVVSSVDDFFVHRFMDSCQTTLQKTNTFDQVESINPDTLKPEAFVQLFQERDLFSPKKLFVINHCEKAKQFAKILNDATLKHCLNSPHSLLIGWSGKTIPSKHILRNKQIDLLNFAQPYPSEIPAFVQSLALKRQLKIDSASAKFLSEELGHDFILLDNELKNLALANTSDTKSKTADVTTEQLKNHLSHYKAQANFAVVDALLDENHAKASQLLERSLHEGETPISILGLLARHIRIALTVQSSLATGNTNTQELCRSLRIPRFQMNHYTAYLRKRSKNRLLRALRLCSDLDFSFKSSRLSPTLGIEQLLRIL